MFVLHVVSHSKRPSPDIPEELCTRPSALILWFFNPKDLFCKGPSSRCLTKSISLYLWLPSPSSFLSPNTIICMGTLNMVSRYIWGKKKTSIGSYDGTQCKYGGQPCVPSSPQRTSELFVPDTLHNMLPGFKKTLFHVLTLISLVCQPGALRGSLLYAAVICSSPGSLCLLYLCGI